MHRQALEREREREKERETIDADTGLMRVRTIVRHTDVTDVAIGERGNTQTRLVVVAQTTSTSKNNAKH